MNDKDGYMRTIMNYVKPDVVLFNEVGTGFSNATRMLTNIFNVSGTSKYSIAWFGTNSDMGNVFIYNNQKVGLINQKEIKVDLNGAKITRQIDVYNLYVKSSDLAGGMADTAFITMFGAHFKAGKGASNESLREKACKAIMNYIKTKGVKTNYLLLGDLNLYRASEGAFQELTNRNSTYNFVDPTGATGTWSSNFQFKDYHTQSTHTNSDCYVGGGMDDRFDFVLLSQGIENADAFIGYKSNSYKTLGQDGKRYNGSLKSPVNNSAPVEVINALYDNSDHLPVYLDLEVNKPFDPVSIQQVEDNFKVIVTGNPVENSLSLSIKGYVSTERVQLKILNINGQLMKQEVRTISSNEVEALQVDFLNPGLYLLQIQLDSGSQKVIKFLKK